jgi:hypothetical protein
MLRDVDMNEISDGKLYSSNDLVKADCQDCKGCSDCCKGMGNSIVLDPLDLHRLSVGLSKAPEKLLEREVGLDIFDGNILPHLKMEGASESCLFLDGNGRCSIHPFRPGICRLFPLGRYYENGSYQYFLQVNECAKTNRSKIKVKKWLDTPQLKQYEAYINDWHYFLKDVQEILYNSEDSEKIRTLNLSILQNFYLTPYDSGKDFYEQFNARLEAAKEKLREE